MTKHKVILVSWRDIPAQIMVGRGRKGHRAALSERFEKAIDRAAMRAGLRSSDAYMNEWRREVIAEEEGKPAEIAARHAARIEAEHDDERLRALALAEGRAEAANQAQG